MAKIMKREPKDLDFGLSGHSNETGILIRVEGIEELRMPDDRKAYLNSKYPGAFAAILDNGEIAVDTAETEDLAAKQEKYNKVDIPRIKKLGLTLFVLHVVCWILLIPSVLVNQYLPTALMSTAFILLGLSRIPEIVYTFAMALLGSERFRQMNRFHYAEHAAINAFYDLKKVPTLDEVKNYSGFSYNCGVAYKIKQVWFWIVIGICRFAPDNWYFLALLIMLPLYIWSMKNNLYWTEIISLRKPGDKEYQVAIAALSRALEYKEKIDEIKEMISADFSNAECIAHFVITIGCPEDDTQEDN